MILLHVIHRAYQKKCNYGRLPIMDVHFYCQTTLILSHSLSHLLYFSYLPVHFRFICLIYFLVHIFILISSYASKENPREHSHNICSHHLQSLKRNLSPLLMLYQYSNDLGMTCVTISYHHHVHDWNTFPNHKFVLAFTINLKTYSTILYFMSH